MRGIYTGHILFADLDDDMVDDVIKSGDRLDITLTNDAMTAELRQSSKLE
jgi:hypothetical protein